MGLILFVDIVTVSAGIQLDAELDVWVTQGNDLDNRRFDGFDQANQRVTGCDWLARSDVGKIKTGETHHAVE